MGRFHLVRDLFRDLPGDVVHLIWASGFRHFIAALPNVGELTISPMSFSAIIGIAFGGTPVSFDVNYYHFSESARGQYVCDLLRFQPTWKNRKNIVLSSLVESFR